MNNEIEDIKILSIDGGGVRGTTTVAFLQHVEDYLLQTEHKTLYEYFDGFVGASSGGVIALGLSSGLSVHEISDLVLKENIDRVLTETPFYDIYNSKYTDEKREVFKKIFDQKGITNKFLGDNDKLCAVTTYDLTDKKAHVFSSLDSDMTDSHISFLDAADATSAAPSYFPPVKIAIGTHEDYFIDGGVISRQPSMTAYSIAKLAYPDLDSNHIKIFSVGASNNDGKSI
ncbi:MAG: patatin-like phospholipase family protein, partial [Anaplasmataceae bacterium]|nr:patatin-like phospholipase family protein [Anaplasmataceae bacterium]